MDKIRAAIRFFEVRSQWLGEGGHPVPVQQAQRRADVCLKCQKNDKTMPLYEGMATEVALLVRRQLELKSQMNLRVNGEEGLHVCSGCLCILKLKVHVPMKFIASTSDMTKLDPKCWIISESQ